MMLFHCDIVSTSAILVPLKAGLRKSWRRSHSHFLAFVPFLSYTYGMSYELLGSCLTVCTHALKGMVGVFPASVKS